MFLRPKLVKKGSPTGRATADLRSPEQVLTFIGRLGRAPSLSTGF